ncbi:MAG TPA: patatin-like phospholipase family protein [Nitrososphaeraceae archaeon]|nr:patatin-like phospholipase family protein [Nitrososphaeraceae archaeon]
MSDTIENVLILQGGGSLGAFGCGVFKALANSNIKLDIIAGTSIGGLNASIIAGSRKEEDHPEKALEQFWLELAEGSSSIIKSNTNLNSPFIDGLKTILELKKDFESFLAGRYPMSRITSSSTDTTVTSPIAAHSAITHISQIKSIQSFYDAAIHGNNKVFMPRWKPEYALTDPQYFTPLEWTYLYDHSPLINTLEKYIDYNRLQPNGRPNARLIVTAVNVLTSEPLIFDSSKQQITSKHILATTGYPRYYFRWVEVEKGIYAWDGSLLSNTPLREVIDASPAKDKRVFLVENYPRYSERLPDNLLEVEHRTRDIMFCDKTLHNKQMAKAITYYLEFINELYHVIEDRFDLENVQDKEKFEKIKTKYKKIAEDHGAQIKSLHYISRDEPFPDLYENADFSIDTIKASIRDGELKTKQILNDHYRHQRNVV